MRFGVCMKKARRKLRFQDGRIRSQERAETGIRLTAPAVRAFVCAPRAEI